MLTNIQFLSGVWNVYVECVSAKANSHVGFLYEWAKAAFQLNEYTCFI